MSSERALPKTDQVLVIEFQSTDTWVVWPVKGERGREFDVLALFPRLNSYEKWDFSRSAIERLSESDKISKWGVETLRSFNNRTRAFMRMVDFYGEERAMSVLGMAA